MSSPKTKKVKSSSKAKPAAGEQAHQEPTRDEKAAFVKAMLHGIQPGTRAAKVMAEKKAGGKKAAAKVASKKTEKKAAGKKADGKKADGKKANSKTKEVRPVEREAAGEARVEILRKISAPEPVISTPKSDEYVKLAQDLEKALEKGELEFIQPHAVQALMMALCKFYAANDENDIVYPVLPGRLAISGTDAMVVCGALLRAVDLQVFELGMFQSWSGR